MLWLVERLSDGDGQAHHVMWLLESAKDRILGVDNP
jgi:hypothetical protein